MAPARAAEGRQSGACWAVSQVLCVACIQHSNWGRGVSPATTAVAAGIVMPCHPLPSPAADALLITCSRTAGRRGKGTGMLESPTKTPTGVRVHRQCWCCACYLVELLQCCC